ncbi:hypothetical protein PR048_033309 [Dryococelus australis]|uniref:Odorant receptor n=1 Tax=Dryococelus australis TaxID=614101 RepID=A0ABQ9G170_9NEOP|nr:hypothetical protein PR048_033309 [Dryococelus australis]
MTCIPVAFNAMLLVFQREKFEEIVSNVKSFMERTICKSTEETLQRALADEKKVAILFAVVLSFGIFTNCLEPPISYFVANRNANDTSTMELPVKMYPMGEENIYIFLWFRHCLSLEFLVELASPRRTTTWAYSNMEESPEVLDMQRPSAERVMSRALKLLLLSGLWSTGNGSASTLRSIILLSSTPLMMLIGTSYLLVAKGETDTAIENTCIAMTCIPVAFNAMLLVFQREKFEEIVLNLKSFVASTICKSTEEPLQRTLAAEKKVAVLLMVVMTFAIFSNCLEPPISYFVANRNANDTFTMELPVKMYPMGEENIYIFLWLYVLQVVLHSIVFVIFTTEEIFLCSLIISATTQFEILIKLIKNADCMEDNLFYEMGDGDVHRVSQTSRKEFRLRGNVVEYIPAYTGSRYSKSTIRNNENPKSDKNEEGVIFWRKIATFHQEALANAIDVCDLLRTTLFLHYVVSSLIICLLLYQLSTSEEIFNNFYICCFLISMLARLFILNLLPTRLTVESEAVANAISATEWYNYSNQVKSSLVIIICRAQRPVYMWAGRFAVMSLETYAAVRIH